MFNRSPVSSETFSNFIKQNKVQCVMVDAYTKYDSGEQEIGKLYFLAPAGEYQDNWSFFRKSPLLTALYYVEMFLVTLGISFVVFALILVFYYKIFLYVVFGSKKE
jgi:hypothetical protein